MDFLNRRLSKGHTRCVQCNTINIVVSGLSFQKNFDPLPNWHDSCSLLVMSGIDSPKSNSEDFIEVPDVFPVGVSLALFEGSNSILTAVLACSLTFKVSEILLLSH